MKKLTRCSDDRMFAGVCCGIGRYFDIDPVIVRVLCIIGAIVTKLIPFVALYIIVALLMPRPAAAVQGAHTPKKKSAHTKTRDAEIVDDAS